MPTTRTAIAAATAILALLAPPAAAIPSDPRCLGLVAGSTGLPLDTGPGRGGLGAPAAPQVARTLPDAVIFRTATETFGREHAFALRAGQIYARRATVGRAAPGTSWRLLALPACLRGNVTEISADGTLLLALTRDRTLYSHDTPGGDLSPEHWTWRWGPYFWTGLGMKLFGDVAGWAVAELVGSERFTDSAGRERHTIGIATVYLLRRDGRRITYLDPWLPADESREVCGPHRGTLPLAGLSGSGSTVFVVGRRGELYTRLYDFDISGANTVAGGYSWQQDRPADDPLWQPPRASAAGADHRPDLDRQDRPGVGRSAAARRGPRPPRADGLLGEAPDGEDVALRTDGRAADRHAVVAAAAVLRARRPPLRGDDRRPPGRGPRLQPCLLAGTSARDRRSRRGARPAAALRRRAAPGDARPRPRRRPARLQRRDRGAARRVRTAARRRPAQGVDRRPARPATDRDRAARGHEHAAALRAQCWALTLDGAPARPDAVRIPPDLGAIVARLNEQRRDARPPDRC